jgi:hypothetical protein
MKERGIETSVAETNAMALSKYGMKIFEDDPQKVLLKTIEKNSKMMAQKYFFDALYIVRDKEVIRST